MSQFNNEPDDGPKREPSGCWIPPGILHDPELSLARKVVYARICSLAQREGFCFAGNKHLAEELGVSERQVRRHIRRLETNGYIRRQIIRDHNGICVQRRLYPSKPAQHQPEDENVPTPHDREDGNVLGVRTETSSRWGRNRPVDGRDVMEEGDIDDARTREEQRTEHDEEVALPRWADLEAGYTVGCEDCREAASDPKRRREACKPHYVPVHERGQDAAA